MRRHSYKQISRRAIVALVMGLALLPASGAARLPLAATAHLSASRAAQLPAAAASAPVSVVTQHNDNLRSGDNLNETILNTSNVNVNQFGLLFRRPVDGQIYAQPLYVPHVAVPNLGTHNVIYVATMHNSVYAFDADDPAQSTPLWTVNLGPSVPPHDFGGGYNDIAIEIGILGTPVIDLSTNTMYLDAFTKDSSTSYVHRLHALDITTGAEKFGGPVVITASVPGSGTGGSGGVVTFQAQQHLQRPGLLLSNGVVYLSYASHGDSDPYHGWVLGYNATTLKQVFVYNATPNGSEGRAGVWESGQAPSADAAGSIYVITGNGAFDANNAGGTEYGDSFVKLNPSGGTSPVADWFTPYNEAQLDASDADLGSAGTLLLPGTNLLVGGGKQGKLYVLDTTNMGHFNAGNDNQIVQSWQATTGGQIHGTPVYYNGPTGQLIYLWGDGDYLKAYRLAGGTFQTTPAYTSTMQASGGCTSCTPGGILSLSANGSAKGTGILWAALPYSGNANQATQPGILRAFAAANVGVQLWSSAQNPTRDWVGTFAKFCPPTVANGKVYLATFSGYLDVYGLLPPPPTPTNTPTPAPTNTPGGPTPVPTNTPTPTPVDPSNGLAAAYNNAGISSNSNMAAANFDMNGYSYSAQALQAAGLIAGQPVVSQGVTFVWPNAAPGALDNVIARGQTITLTQPLTGSTLAFLGAASNGSSAGTATISYGDGTTQSVTLGFTDWAQGASPAYGNAVVATMPYRNNVGGTAQAIKVYVYYAAVGLQPGKIVTSITLPATVSGGQLHIFAFGAK